MARRLRLGAKKIAPGKGIDNKCTGCLPSVLHGFHWVRTSIRYHVILNNVGDAAPDYVMQSTTRDPAQGRRK